jgi:hypothetical protein
MTKKDIHMHKDRASSAMGGGKKKSKKKKSSGKHVHEMHIRHAANGGYIVKHHFKPVAGGGGQPQEPEEHAIPDMPGLQDHVQDNMQQPPPQQAQPQPAPAAQPGM